MNITPYFPNLRTSLFCINRHTILRLSIFLCIIHGGLFINIANSATWNYTGGNPNIPGNWSGAPNFTTAGDIFQIPGGSTAVLTGMLNLGTNVTLRILNMGTLVAGTGNPVVGPGNFDIQAGGTLQIGNHPSGAFGWQGAIGITGTTTANVAASYIFNGAGGPFKLGFQALVNAGQQVGNVTIQNATWNVETSYTIQGSVTVNGGALQVPNNVNYLTTLSVIGAVNSTVTNGVVIQSNGRIIAHSGGVIGAPAGIFVVGGGGGASFLRVMGTSNFTGAGTIAYVNGNATLDYVGATLTTGLEFPDPPGGGTMNISVVIGTGSTVSLSGPKSLHAAGGAGMFMVTNGTINIGANILSLRGTVNLNGAPIQSAGGTLVFGNAGFAPVNFIGSLNVTGTLAELHISRPLQVIPLAAPISVTGVMFATSGTVIANMSNMITLNNNAATSLRATNIPNLEAFLIRGPFRRLITTSAGVYNFPLGYPTSIGSTFAVLSPVTAGGDLTLEVEVVGAPSAGVPGTALGGISMSEYWRTAVVAGPGTFVNGSIQLSRSTGGLTAMSVVCSSATLAGVYQGMPKQFLTLSTSATAQPAGLANFYVLGNAISPITITGRVPAPSGINITATPTITATFSQNVTGATANGVKIFGGMTGLRAGTVTPAANSVSVTPVTPFRPGEKVFVSVTGAQSVVGITAGTLPPRFNTFSFTVSAGMGPGTFFESSRPQTAGNNPRETAVADFNNDGFIDFAVIDGTNVNIFTNVAGNPGTFTLASIPHGIMPGNAIATGDLDGDGDSDLVIIGGGGPGQQVLINTGGVFGAPVATGGPGGQSVVLTDIDGNGTLDIITCGGTTMNYVMNNGNGTFSPGPMGQNVGGASLISLATGDFNNDGYPDFVAADQNANNRCVAFVTTDYITFNQVVLTVPPTNSRAVSAGDFNNDGFLDIASTFQTGVRVFNGNGLGGFSGGTDYITGTGMFGLTNADVTGDGRLDLIAADNATNQMVVLINTGASFAAPVLYKTGFQPFSVNSADIDNDGDMDLFVPNFGMMPQNTISIFKNADIPRITAAAPRTSSTIPPATAITGSYSLPMSSMTAATVSAAVVRISGNQTGRTSTGTITTVLPSSFSYSPGTSFKPGETVSVSVTHAQSSAGVRVLTSTTFTYQVAVNAGPGSFSVTRPYPSGMSPVGVAMADFNKDGNLDVITANNLGGLSYYAGGGTHSISLPSFIAAAPNPYKLITGDWDGDGDPDLAVAHDNAGGSFSVYVNDPPGTLTQTVSVGIGPNPHKGITSGDFDRDGVLDFAITTPAGNSVTILFGNGRGATPVSRVITIMGVNSPWGIVAGDWDGDWDLDLAVTLSGLNQVGLLINDGSGGFTLGPTFGTGTTPQSISSADLNNDGFWDLVITNSASNNLSVLFGNSSGTFNVQPTIAVGGTPFEVITGDINGNGLIDVVTLCNGSLTTSNNNGAGAFTTRNFPSGLFVNNGLSFGDLNNDGDLDLAVTNSAANQLIILANATAPTILSVSPLPYTNTAATSATMSVTFSLPMTTATASANSVKFFGGFRGVRTTTYTQNNDITSLTPTIPLYSGENVFVSVTSASSTEQIFSTRSTVYGFRATAGIGAGTFVYSTNAQTQNNPHGMAAADFDANGAVDLAIVNRGSNSISLLSNTASGLVFSGTLITPANPEAVVAADIDLDGDMDLITANNALVPNGSITVYRNLGGGFMPVNTYSLGVSGANSIAVHDMDGDGDLDVVVGSKTSSRICIFYNVGNGQFTMTPATLVVPAQPEIVIVADVDADGDLDILSGNGSANTISIFVNTTPSNATNGAVAFMNAWTLNPGFTVSALECVDLDGDRVNDLAAAGAGTVLIYRNLGTGGSGTNPFSPAGLFTVPALSNIRSIVAADVDGDGDLDIATANKGRDNVSVLINNGGSFTVNSPVSLNSGASPNWLVSADMDGDKDMDLVSVDSGTNTVSVLLNQPAPTLSITPTVINLGTFQVNTPVQTSYRLTGTNLISPATIIVADTSRCSISDQSGVAFIPQKVLVFTPIAGVIDTTIYVQISTTATGTLPFTRVVNTSATVSPIIVSITGTAAVPIPTLTSFSPQSAVSGELLTVKGINFTGVNGIELAGMTVTGFTINNDTTITLQVPASGGESRSGVLILKTASGSTSSTQQFQFIDTPVITSFSPPAGSPGSSISLFGKNFVNITNATIGGITTASFMVVSTTQMVVVAGGGKTGTILLRNKAGTGSSAQTFEFTNLAGITEFSPQFGTTGTTVFISGSNLGSVTTVKFNGLSTTATVLSTTQVSAVVPAGASSGTISVYIQAFDYTAVSAAPFTIVQPPQISNISPTTATIETIITITGSNFASVTSVTIGGVPVANFTVESPNQITVVPAPNSASAKSGPITIYSIAGSTTSQQQFQFIKLPVITSYSPTAATAGTIVTMTGSNFVAINDVSFGGVPMKFIVLSSTKMTIEVSTTANSGFITVSNPAGTATAQQQFLLIIPEPPGFTALQRDSSILVKFYAATSGLGWKDTTNWLSEKPVQTWFGVGVDSTVSGTTTTVRVTRLILRDNGLRGSVPAVIAGLTSLKVLDLSNNALSGTLPATIATLTALEELRLTKNLFSGQIPDSIFRLTALKKLYLDSNNLSGMIPLTLCLLPSAEEIVLRRNKLTGTIPVCIGEIRGLKLLDLSDNQITGAIPPEIQNLTALRELILAKNILTGFVPSFASTATQRLQKERVGELTALLSVQKIDLSRNKLTGQIPDSLWNLPELRELNLSYNELFGSLSSNIGASKQLRILSLRNNLLTGSIPSTIGLLDSLRVLQLDVNKFSGVIPPSILNIKQLIELGVSSNRFTDTIPLISQLPLSVVRLDTNRFTFASIEPIMGLVSSTQSFSYSPQDSLGTARDTTIVVDKPFSLSVSVGGSSNRYQWYKRETTAEGITFDNFLPGKTSPILSLPVFSVADTGLYGCIITNSRASRLRLYQRLIKVAFRLPNPPVAAPALLEPLNGAAGVSTRPKFRWSAVQDAGRYEFELATDSLFTITSTIAASTLLTTERVQTTNLTNSTAYFWRVRALNSGGTSPWSAVGRFRTLSVGADFSLTSIDMGRASVGDSTSAMLVITNLREETMTLNNIQFSSSEFALVNEISTLSIPGNQSLRLEVWFKPKTSGSKLVDVTLSYIPGADNPKTVTQASVIIARAGTLKLIPTSGNLGSFIINIPNLKILNLVNVGGDTLLARITILKKDGIFALDQNFPEAVRLIPHDTTAPSLNFTLKDTLTYSDTLQITAGRDTLNMVLQATGRRAKTTDRFMKVGLKLDQSTDAVPGDTVVVSLLILPDTTRVLDPITGKPKQNHVGKDSILITPGPAIAADVIRILESPSFSATFSMTRNVLLKPSSNNDILETASSKTLPEIEYSVPLTPWVYEKNDSIFSTKFIVVLGDADSAVIQLKNFSWVEQPNQGKDTITLVTLIDPTPQVLKPAYCRIDGTARLISAGQKTVISALYPNPAFKEVNLVFSLREAGVVDISLYDLSGKKVRTLMVTSLSNAGSYSLLFDTGGLPPGSYQLMMSTATSRHAVIMEVVR